MTSPSIPPFSLPEAFPVAPILPTPVPPAFKPIPPKPIIFPEDHLISADGMEALKKAAALIRTMQNAIDTTFVKVSTQEALLLCSTLKTLVDYSNRLLDTLVVTTIVIAGNYMEFTDWCAARMRDPKEHHYIHKAEQLHGLRFAKVECVGTWFERRDILEIMQALGRVNQV